MKIPIEAQFAQTLAANEKKLRDRGVRKLREWLTARSSTAETMFCDEEMLKLWKGLFYCMWMSDKPLIQEELAAEISDMIHCFTSTEAALLFVDTFFQTMNREWFGLDKWRIDKFMMFVRKFLNQCFCLMRRLRWEDETISALMNVLTKTVICTNGENLNIGLQIHVADIYVEELAKVASKKVSGDKLTAFFVPYCHMLVECNTLSLRNTVATRVFEFAIRLSGVDDDDQMDDMTDVDDELEEYEEKDDDTDEDDVYNLDVEAKWKTIVHRHEIRAQELPFPNFDYKALGDKLLDIAGKCKDCNRKKLARVHSQVKNLYEIAKGIFPLDVVPDVIPESDDDEEAVESAVGSLMKFEEKLRCENEEYKRKNKKKGVKRKAIPGSEEDIMEEKQEDKDIIKRKKKKEVKDNEDKIRNDSEPRVDKLMLRLLKKAADEKSQMQKPKEVEGSRDLNVEEQRTIEKKKKKRNKRKKTSMESSKVETNDVQEEIVRNIAKEFANEITDETANDSSEHSIKENDEKTANEISETVTSNSKGTTIKYLNVNQANGLKKPKERKAFSVTSMKKLQPKSRYFNLVVAEEVNGGNEKEKPKNANKKKKMKKDEASPNTFKSQELIKFESFTKSPPAFFKKVVLKASPKCAKKRLIASKLTNGNGRKVNFVLAKNLEHEMTDYAVSVRSSPAIPFDARKLPSQGVLKATPAKTTKRATAKMFF